MINGKKGDKIRILENKDTTTDWWNIGDIYTLTEDMFNTNYGEQFSCTNNKKKFNSWSTNYIKIELVISDILNTLKIW